jgi:hypothetical protein
MSLNVPAPHHSIEPVRTHAERMQHEADERLQRKALLFAEQHSSENSPAVRIRAWEKAHALYMPSNSQHPVLRAIAASTGLTVAQVQEEQLARQARVATADKPIA